MIGQWQRCKHVSDSFPDGCVVYGYESEFWCGRDCELFDGCLGYQFEYLSEFYGSKEYYLGYHTKPYNPINRDFERPYFTVLVGCVLFPSKSTFTKCPEHYERRSGTGYTLAENAEELVGGPFKTIQGLSGSRGLCYRRINKNKLQSR